MVQKHYVVTGWGTETLCGDCMVQKPYVVTETLCGDSRVWLYGTETLCGDSRVQKHYVVTVRYRNTMWWLYGTETLWWLWDTETFHADCEDTENNTW